MTLGPRELLIGGALVACSYVDRLACGLRRRVRAHLHAASSERRAARCNGGKAPRDATAYETACAAFCAGASHS